MRIDLHTHSDRSDGTDTPAELVRHAHDVGSDVLGLTDHDTTEGWEEAADVAERLGVSLVRGIEISARYQGDSVRIIYLHVPAAWLGMGGWTGIAVASFMQLVWRHPLAAVAGRALAVPGALFTALCLVSGSRSGSI